MANITGTANNDTFEGTFDNDLIQGLAGNDSIRGNSGDDTIDPGLGYDTVDGGQNQQSLWQGYYIEDNLLIVDYSSNTYTGSYSGITSNTSLFVSQGYFSAYYNSNYDADVVNFTNIKRFHITGTEANDNIVTGSGNDTIAGGAGDDTITSGYGNDMIASGDGDDTMLDSSGNDTMTGGAGNDVYVIRGFNNAGDVVNETSILTTEIDTVQSEVGYKLGANVERLTLIGTSAINGTGNSLNNTVTGNSANNTLFGGIGSDTITGGMGNDLLIGVSGNDILTGGDGSDRFIYSTNAAFTSNAIGIDRITDFVSGTDKIVLDKTTFSDLTSIAGNGFNLADEFAVVGSDAAASTASALIVYSSETDNLFYNQNGVTSGFGSGAQLATLSGITTLSPSDFELQA
jgi:Ca2+-binding RTX toxin-like protein